MSLTPGQVTAELVRSRGGSVDRTLLAYDGATDRVEPYVLVAKVEPGMVAHVPRWADDGLAAWWEPACGANAHRRATLRERWDRWTFVDAGIPAVFGRACRRCRWPDAR